METDRAEPGVAGDHGKEGILRASLLAGIAGESCAALLELARVERLPRRHLIALQGEPPETFLLIGKGRVKVERRRDDHALSLGHRGPGQMVGETAVAGAPVATESASVVDEVEALAFPIPAIRRQLAEDPPLRAAVCAAILEQHQALEQRLTALLLHGVEARLAGFLVDAVGRWGRAHPEGEIVTAPFTHAEIAFLIGSTRETVTLVLGKLKRDGLLSFDRRRAVIRDRSRLEQRAAAS
jgi:CRP/FNR family transcriptional regulator, cyclic AMP receptor protein